MSRAPKFMLIGLDSLSIEIIDRYAADGTAPTLARMIKAGVSGHAMPEFPVYTPTNWAVLATGARPGTNGAQDWFNDLSGQHLSTFDSRAISCESIQDAAGRQGLKLLSIMYPGGYPVRHPNCMAVSPLQKGLSSNELYHGRIWEAAVRQGQASFAFLTAAEQGAVQSGAAAAKAVGATEDGADTTAASARARGTADLRFGVRLQGDRFAIECGAAQATGRVGTWSPFVFLNLPTPSGRRKGSVRFKVFPPRGGRVRIASSGVYDLAMIVTPRRLQDALLRAAGPVFEHATFNNRLSVDSPTLTQDLAETVEELEYQVDWIVRAARLVQAREGMDILYVHWHFPDNVLHSFLAHADPSAPGYTPARGRRARGVIRAALRLCDRLVRGLQGLAGSGTHLCVVSDHGNVPNHFGFDLKKRLVETGLAVVRKDGSYDMRHTPAYTEGAAFKVSINRRHVRADGVGAMEQRIIDALHDWRVPGTGERVVAFAFRRRDAAVMGFWGPTTTDVSMMFNAGFAWCGYQGEGSAGPARGGANHGPQMPTTFTGFASNMAFFILTGPGVKRNCRWNADQGFVRLVDLLPTLCHLSGMEPPRDCEGAVRYRVKA